MRVKIGKYVGWIGPYQIAQKILFWKDRDSDIVHNFGTFLAGEDNDSTLSKICGWIHSKRKRNIKVKIHGYDTWSVDGTLAIITLPLLKQLKETKHGSPFTDDEDVPVEIRSTSAKPKENEWDVDGFHFQRWDYVLDEMIWTFEQLQPDYDWEIQFWTGKSDWKFDRNEDGTSTMREGENHTLTCDKEARDKHVARMNNGLRLFGKYYMALWS